jgi:S-DNA-T family DNA segregation ATPase FtsK/SpoIIIE
MRVKLRLLRAGGTVGDVVVTADGGATVGDVAQTIVRLAPEATRTSGGTPTMGVTFPGEQAPKRLDPMTPIAESAVASGVQVAVVDDAAPDDGAGPVRALVRVVDGPDRGAEFQIRRGAVIVGRDRSADFVLSDPLVSKKHVRIEISRTVDLVDLNSANGIVVDGGLVTRISLASGGVAQLGDSVLRFDIVGDTAAPDTAGRNGAVQFNRSPRVERRYPGDEYEGPEIPKEEDPMPFPWVALAAPLVMGIVFIFLPGVSALRFVFIALAPIIMIGTFLSQLAVRRRKRKLAIEKYEKQLAYLASTLEGEEANERAVRLAEAPAVEDVVAQANGLGPLLWTRRPEHWSFLNVRLALGAATTRNKVKGLNSRNGLPEYIERFEALVEKHRLIEGVPLAESLADAGAIGVAGRGAPGAEAINGVLVQLAGLHSPAELAFAALVSPSRVPQFEWLKWLPHTGSVHSPLSGTHLSDSVVATNALLASLEELIAERSAAADATVNRRGPILEDDSVLSRGAKVGETDLEAGSDAPPPVPALVLLVSDDAPVDRARLISLVERAAAAGVYPIWLSDTVERLPAVCRTFLHIEDGVAPGADGSTPAEVGYVRVGERFHGTAVRVPGDVARDFALRLAGVTDAGAYVADESDLPKAVSFLALVGDEMAEASDAVIDRWRQNDSVLDRSSGAPVRRRRAGRLRSIVGQGAQDAMHLDLRTQGPHALVGGTTGSGKSEFLQAWVLGMAAEYSPDRVTFLFVDYKGGSAFADCVNLPHCVGLVTDLSPHLVRRALTSLRAELHHRERLFNRKKVKDLIELEKTGDPECPPALVLVIDEFAALVGDVPEFVDGVVDIAQRGRSLGIHLIMATQRPAGVIRDNLRANTNLRVALRMADSHDSIDVVGSPVAAGFDPTVPGRAVVKTGPGRLDSFQTGYAGGWTTSAVERPAVDIADLGFGLEVPWEAPDADVEEVPSGDPGPTDIARMVATITRAAAEARVPAPRKPWLDELAATFDLARMAQRTDEELLLGVADDPAHQEQRVVSFRPDVDGNLAVFGTGGSGKSTALRTLAIAAGITPRGGPVQVYGIDFSSGGLRMLEPLPHVGSIIAGDDAERILRLMRMLRAVVDDRTKRFGAVSAGTIAEYRSLAGRPQEPRILLLVDGMATFRQEYEFTGVGGVFPMFQQLLSDGRQLGIHVVVSADRPASVPPTVAASMQRRVALRLADDNDYLLLDSPSDVLSASSPPGRAIVDGLETQLAVFGGSSNTAAQAGAIEKLAEALRAQGRTPTPAIERLPERIERSELGAPRPGRLTLGIADDTLSPVSVAAEGAFLIAGPPGSGRTTALLALAQAARDADPDRTLIYLGHTRSPLRTSELWSRSAGGPEEVQTFAKELLERASVPAKTGERLGIFIEAIPDFLSSPADPDLLALIKAARRNEHLVVAEGETSSMLPSWPLLMELKAARRGFALQPDQQEGDAVFRTSFPRARRADFPVGRGWLVEGGKVQRVQLALP